jgi:hypothetical protein
MTSADDSFSDASQSMDELLIETIRLGQFDVFSNHLMRLLWMKW